MKHTPKTVSASLKQIADLRRKNDDVDKFLKNLEKDSFEFDVSELDHQKEAPLRLPYSSDPLPLGEQWK